MAEVDGQIQPDRSAADYGNLGPTSPTHALAGDETLKGGFVETLDYWLIPARGIVSDEGMK